MLACRRCGDREGRGSRQRTSVYDDQRRIGLSDKYRIEKDEICYGYLLFRNCDGGAPQCESSLTASSQTYICTSGPSFSLCPLYIPAVSTLILSLLDLSTALCTAGHRGNQGIISTEGTIDSAGQRSDKDI